MTTIYTFEQVLEMAQSNVANGLCVNKKHLLLGNGFSRAYFGADFSYQTLFDSIKNEKENIRIKKFFEYFGSSNFEAVLTSLRDTQFILGEYGSNLPEINTDYERIKNALAEAIIKVHPPKTNAIPDIHKLSCLEFLNIFDEVLTVNYDLLLYWVVVQNDGGFGDYFDRDIDTPMEYCEYFRDGSKSKKHIYFLHGALHLFQKNGRTIKKVWGNVAPLIEQIKEEMTKGYYPLVVAEGDSKSKLNQIKSIPYLDHSFSKLENLGGQFFTFGFSFSEQDQHIADTIAKNPDIRFLWIGIRGDFTKEANQKIISTVQGMQKKRKTAIEEIRFGKSKSGDLQVYFFDTGLMNIWSI